MIFIAQLDSLCARRHLLGVVLLRDYDLKQVVCLFDVGIFDTELADGVGNVLALERPRFNHVC